MTSFYNVVNNFRTVLAEDLPASQTYLYLEDDDGIPSYPCVLTIWNTSVASNPNDDPTMEIVILSADYAGDGKHTITRAAEDTNDVAHSAGDVCACLMTAGIITQIQDAINALE